VSSRHVSVVISFVPDSHDLRCDRYIGRLSSARGSFVTVMRYPPPSVAHAAAVSAIGRGWSKTFTELLTSRVVDKVVEHPQRLVPQAVYVVTCVNYCSQRSQRRIDARWNLAGAQVTLQVVKAAAQVGQ
jgi:hypothetical protein